MTCREEGTEGWAPVPPDDSWQPRCGDWWQLGGEEQLRVGRPPARLFLTEGTLWKCCCVTKGVCFSSYWGTQRDPVSKHFAHAAIQKGLLWETWASTAIYFFLWLSCISFNAFKMESSIRITLTVNCTTTETRFTHLCWLYTERYAPDTRGKFSPRCVGEFVVLVQPPVGTEEWMHFRYFRHQVILTTWFVAIPSFFTSVYPKHA